MDFRSYDSSVKANNGYCSARESGDEAAIRDIAGKYAGKSQDEMMAEVKRRADKMKADGSYNPAQIEEMYAKLAPMLDEGQKQKLDAVMKMLRG